MQAFMITLRKNLVGRMIFRLAVFLLIIDSARLLADVIPPDPERQGMPSLERPHEPPKRTDKRTEEDVHALAEYQLPSPINRIELQTDSSPYEENIRKILSTFLGKERVTARELEVARGRIWSFYREQGRLSRVDLQVMPYTHQQGGAQLHVWVYEINVRQIKVEEESGHSISRKTLDDILRDTRADIAEGGVLDLDRLDSRIKRRLFLEDLAIRASLVPVDQNQVDVKVLVSKKQPQPVGWLAQYDNHGTKSYGRDRLTVGASTAHLLMAGDQLDGAAVKSEGMAYIRLGYELPITRLGGRMTLWGSYLDYESDAGLEGQAPQWGAQFSYPLYISDKAFWTGDLGYTWRQQEDALRNGTVIGDKQTQNIHGALDLNYLITPAQSLRLNTTFRYGELDLSELPDVLALDQLSARTNGYFTKFEWQGSWSLLFGASGQFDARLATHGQVTDKNLDQSEKFSLGGFTGVRAYGPAEAMGDEGNIVTAELGYRALHWLRGFVFYDTGRIRRHEEPWGVDAVPEKYDLDGAGLGLALSSRSVVGSLTFARQLGDNPGLQANGLDSEGSDDKYRLWFSLTGWF